MRRKDVAEEPEAPEEIAYQAYVKAKIQAGLESAQREPTVSLEEGRERLEAVIRSVGQTKRGR
jgi:hypothetical protein